MTNLYSASYIENVLIRFAYHSTGIEGNTISLRDTQRILESGKLPSTPNHTLRELYEIANHRKVFDFIFAEAQNKRPFSPMFVRECHQLIMDNIAVDAGSFKKFGNMVNGASFKTAEPHEVPIKIQEWCSDLNQKLENVSTLDEKLYILMETHVKFEQIHPFSDGNGRTGRVLLNYGLILDQQPLLVIERQDRDQYIDLAAAEDIKGLVDYAKEKISSEKEIMENFHNTEERQGKFEKQQFQKIATGELKIPKS